jgi:hypothetical protein
MQRPDDGGHARDLPNVTERNFVVSFSLPAKTHLHWYVRSFLPDLYQNNSKGGACQSLRPKTLRLVIGTVSVYNSIYHRFQKGVFA